MAVPHIYLRSIRYSIRRSDCDIHVCICLTEYQDAKKHPGILILFFDMKLNDNGKEDKYIWLENS